MVPLTVECAVVLLPLPPLQLPRLRREVRATRERQNVAGTHRRFVNNGICAICGCNLGTQGCLTLRHQRRDGGHFPGDRSRSPSRPERQPHVRFFSAAAVLWQLRQQNTTMRRQSRRLCRGLCVRATTRGWRAGFSAAVPCRETNRRKHRHWRQPQQMPTPQTGIKSAAAAPGVVSRESSTRRSLSTIVASPAR